MALLSAWHVPRLAVACIVSAGCERIVPIEAAPSDALLVVQARVDVAANEGSAPSFVRLALASALNDNSGDRPVSDALVQISEDSGRTHTFTGLAGRPGLYVSSAPLAKARLYRLQITWRGDQYEAAEPLPRAMPISQLSFVPFGAAAGTFLGSAVAVHFTDLAPGADFYQWEQYTNGRPVAVPDSLFFDAFVRSDSLFNGEPVSEYVPYPFIGTERGVQVRVRQATVSPAAGAYLAILVRQRGSSGEPFERAPFNVRGNVINRTTPARRALGVFAVRHVWEATARAP